MALAAPKRSILTTLGHDRVNFRQKETGEVCGIRSAKSGTDEDTAVDLWRGGLLRIVCRLEAQFLHGEICIEVAQC